MNKSNMKNMNKNINKVILIMVSLVPVILSLLSIFQVDFTCAIFSCNKNVILQSIIFGLSSCITLNILTRKPLYYKNLLYVFLINILLLFTLPESTDYFLPAKEDGIIYFNLLSPILYLVYSSYRYLILKNKK